MIRKELKAQRRNYLSILRAMAACTLLAGLLFVYAALQDRHHFYGAPMAAAAAPVLRLNRLDGTAFDLASLKGHAVLVYFGYTSCPEVCPTTLLDLAEVYAKLGSMKGKVDTVFVTLDPGTDRPEMLRTYLQSFSPVPIGLTGTEAAIAAAASDWGISWTRDPASGYIDHTSSVTLIDPEGHLRTRYGYSQIGDAEAVAKDIRYVIG